MDELSPLPCRAAVFGVEGGIGREIAGLLVRRGWEVHGGARRRPGLAGVIPFVFDLADEGSIAAAVQNIGAPLDLVIVTTGILMDAARGIEPERTLRALDGAAMARVLAINAIGPALVAKHTAPLLARDRRAVFAALSARVGSIGDNRLGGWHSYRASKAALNMIVRNVAIELARTRPRAIAVSLHPGTVDTPLSAPFQRNLPEGQLTGAAEAAARLLAVIDGLTPADSGGFLAWDGSTIPF
jgi:NAD(P)-dependent dehydrogenase (short-subunit alcohol dehydrogenase family)